MGEVRENDHPVVADDSGRERAAWLLRMLRGAVLAGLLLGLAAGGVGALIHERPGEAEGEARGYQSLISAEEDPSRSTSASCG